MWLLSYWLFPVIGASMWLSTLIVLLVRWHIDGSPRYASMSPEQDVAYISDVAAQGLKPFFIVGCSVTVVAFDFSFLSERWLRHRGRLARNKGRIDKSLSILAMIFAILGAAGLILLSIFDTLRHPHVHNGCLVLFIGGYLLSAIFVCLEYLRLGIHYREHLILTVSFWVKLTFIVVELALAIAFGVCSRGNGRKNQAAIIEWVIAFIFTFYVLSFVIDLLPSVRTRHHIPQGERLPEMRTRSRFGAAQVAHHPDRTSQGGEEGAYYEQPLTTDSMGESGNVYRGQVVANPAAAAAAPADTYDGSNGYGYPNGYVPHGRKEQRGVPV